MTTQSAPYNPLVNDLGVQYLFRPVVYERVPLVPRLSDKSPHATNWWKEQFRRTKYGWTEPTTGVFINPAYYFHLNFLQFDIEDEFLGTQGDHINPYYRDNDHYVFDELYNAMGRELRLRRPDPATGEVREVIKYKNAYNLVIAKGRRMAWTTNCWGFSMWQFVTQQHRDFAHLYPDEGTRNRENMKIRRLYAKLHDAFKYATGSAHNRQKLSLVTANMDVLEQGYFVTQADGSKLKVVVNRWYFTVVSSDVGALRGEKLSACYFAEFGKWTNGDDVFNAIKDCLRQGGRKFGCAIIGGTSDMVASGGGDIYRKFFTEAESFDAKPVFLPATRVRLGHFDYRTGKSNEVSALEELRREREKRKNDSKGLLSEMQENPISWEECFIPPTGNEYNSIKLDTHLMYLLRTMRPEDYALGEFYEEEFYNGVKTGEIKFRENGTGPWRIWRGHHKDGTIDGLPIPGGRERYLIGIDDFYKNKKASEVKKKDSKGGIVVWRSLMIEDTPYLNDAPVAYFLDRPTRPEFHRQCLYAIRFYDNCQVNYEYNDDTFLELAEREKVIGKIIYWGDKGWGPKDKPGMYPQGTIQEQSQEMYDLIEKGNVEKWTFPEMIRALKVWQTLNSELASCLHLIGIARKRMPVDTSTASPNQGRAQPGFAFGSQAALTGASLWGQSSQPAGFFTFGSR